MHPYDLEGNSGPGSGNLISGLSGILVIILSCLVSGLSGLICPPIGYLGWLLSLKLTLKDHLFSQGILSSF